ncbi:MAG: LCP family protein [Candidatus Peribacteraceae bacterium]|nr:LCP family protein [Candidatus Peribacteraceae bacterium]MBP9850469.1 LCP family protein [Candidatus Peribacteraceae bacterium]
MSFTTRRVREEKKPSQLRRYAAFALPLLRAATQYYKHFEHAKVEDEVKVKRERTLKRTVTILLSALLVLLLLMGTLKVLIRLKALALGMASVAGVELPADENGFTNILLLGEGNSDHEGVDLTDTIMVASLDPKKTKSAVLLSIPRDTYVLSTEKMGKDRINSLYRNYKVALVRKGMTQEEASAESLKQLMTEVGTLIGLQMHGAVKVNFSGFEEAIDAIGGIDVVLPADLVDTQYPGPNYSYVTFQLAKGPQHLDGATALKYARSRHSTSDFSRSGRQQQIIAAAAKKLKDGGLIKNVSKLTELLSIISKNTESTLSTRELLGLAEMGRALDTEKVVSMQLSDQNGLYGSGIEQGGFLYSPPRDQFDGAAVLLPVSMPEFPVTWKQIQKLSSLLFLQRETYINPSTISVLNAGGKEGLARKLGGELYRFGLNILNTRNYGPKGSPVFETSFIAINPALTSAIEPSEEIKKQLDRATVTAELLATILKFKVGSTPDAAPFESDSADIVIVLGKDFQYTPLQELL